MPTRAAAVPTAFPLAIASDSVDHKPMPLPALTATADVRLPRGRVALSHRSSRLLERVTTHMNDVLRVSSHDELIAFVPHALGFAPQGMVCLAIGGGPIARVDIPELDEHLDGFIDVLTEVYLHQHRPRQIALVAYGDDESTCHRALAALHTALTRSGRGPQVGPVLWVDGDRWNDLIAGTTGTVSSSARTRMDAEFTLLGRRAPAETREQLAAALHGDPTDVSKLMPEATARLLGLDPTALRVEREWLGARVDTFVRDRELLSDHDAARVLAVLHDTGARDAVESRMSRDHAAALSDLWSDLVRRAPADVRDAPAVMLALSSYLGGNGAQAWIALDQMTGPHPLAEAVATALERAIDPRVLEQAFRAEATSALLQRAGLSVTPTQTHQSVHQRQSTPGVERPNSDQPGRGR